MGGAHAGGTDLETVAAGHSVVHHLDPRAKIVGLLGLVIVTVTLPKGAWAALAVALGCLVVVLGAARLPPLHVVQRLKVELPFLFAAAVLPFAADDGLRLGLTLVAKITVSTLAMVLLSSTTPFPALLRGFEQLRAPKLLLSIVAFMWRYLQVLGDELQRMQVARRARGYSARWLWQAVSTGPLIATLFVRSLERGERVYLAMLSRGFTGAMPRSTTEDLALRRPDIAFLAAATGALLVVGLVLR